MGSYIYRTTAEKVRLTDGSLANVAVYAYKPSWSGWDYEKRNREMAFKSGCLASERMKEANMTDKVVFRWSSGEMSGVYGNPKKFKTFYDDNVIGTPDMPPIVGVGVLYGVKSK